MSDAGSSGREAASSSEDRAFAYAGYVLLMLGPFTGGVSDLLTLFFALARRKRAEPMVQGHLENQLRIFRLPVIALGLCVLLAFAAALGLGWPVAALGVLLVIGASLWSAVLALLGLLALADNRPARG